MGALPGHEDRGGGSITKVLCDCLGRTQAAVPRRPITPSSSSSSSSNYCSRHILAPRGRARSSTTCLPGCTHQQAPILDLPGCHQGPGTPGGTLPCRVGSWEGDWLGTVSTGAAEGLSAPAATCGCLDPSPKPSGGTAPATLPCTCSSALPLVQLEGGWLRGMLPMGAVGGAGAVCSRRAEGLGGAAGGQSLHRASCIMQLGAANRDGRLHAHCRLVDRLPICAGMGAHRAGCQAEGVLPKLPIEAIHHNAVRLPLLHGHLYTHLGLIRPEPLLYSLSQCT